MSVVSLTFPLQFSHRPLNRRKFSKKVVEFPRLLRFCCPLLYSFFSVQLWGRYDSSSFLDPLFAGSTETLFFHRHALLCSAPPPFSFFLAVHLCSTPLPDSCLSLLQCSLRADPRFNFQFFRTPRFAPLLLSFALNFLEHLIDDSLFFCPPHFPHHYRYRLDIVRT